MTHNKTGILTWYYYDNFGSVLQAFAINKILPNSEIIDYSPYSAKKNFYYNFKKVAKVIISISFGHFFTRFRYSFEVFKYKKLYLSKIEFDEHNLALCNSIYKNVVCGSDQIWAPNVFNPIYMANFVDGKLVNKISYAASIGLNDIPDTLVGEYKNLLSDFSFISVREETGAELLKRECCIDNVFVALDPTLLLKHDDYKKIERTVRIKGRYIFCYFLNANHQYEEQVKKYANDNNLKIIGWSAKEDDKLWLGDYKWIGPPEFLWLIDNAECVITDSYHGTIFSLLFHKNFLTFERFRSDDPINQNSRIYQLDKWFGISKRIVGPNTDLHVAPFDYSRFEIQLENARKISENYLRKAID